MTLHFIQPRHFQRFLDENRIYYGHHDTVFGPVTIATAPQGVCRLSFKKEEYSFATKAPEKTEPALRSILQMEHVDLVISGTEFEMAIWKELTTIPLAHSRSYKGIATAINRPKAYRAVGNAVGRNKIAIAIPCHRVLPQSGKIGGYYWGPEIKSELIEYEKGLALCQA